LAALEAPVKGVLSEGDRRDAQRVVAPPLASPLGQLLFGETSASLRRRATAGLPLDDASVEGLWREVRRLLEGLRERARRSADRLDGRATAPASSQPEPS
jgi:hypothetical protein